jgi:hypothetical protein
MVLPPEALLAHLTANGQDLQPGVMGLLMDDSSVVRTGGLVAGWLVGCMDVSDTGLLVPGRKCW